jgi:hypothetical protein
LININGSIVLKNGTSAWEKSKNKCPFMNGALKFKPDVLANRLDNKATNLVWDPLANPSLIPNKGPEKSANTRYSNGFKDILQKHFIEQKEIKTVIVLFSHSDGIEPFLSTFSNGIVLKKADYCTTIAVEITSSDNKSYQVKDLVII